LTCSPEIVSVLTGRLAVLSQRSGFLSAVAIDLAAALSYQCGEGIW
jgi:hypothetical protein